MLRPILRLGDSLLQAPAQPVADITPEIERLIDDMIETMYAVPGIGLAAPQVGVSLRIFVIDLSVGRGSQWPGRDDQPRVAGARGHAARGGGLPEPPRLHRHRRPARASRVRGLNRQGEEHVVEGTELLARALQHEIDHLDGCLFVDRLRGISRDLIVRKIKKLARAGKW